MTKRPKLQGLEEERPTIFTIEGWREFVNAPRSYAPERVAPEERAKWSEVQRNAYDQARERHHTQLPTILTPEVQHIIRDAGLQLQSNVSHCGTQCGGIITGPATFGKSTVLQEIGRRYELWFNRTYPPVDPADSAQIIPVVMVGLDTDATAKKLNRSIADFYGATLRYRNTTRDEYKEVIRQRVYLHHTKVILIDDIHYLKKPETQRQHDQMLSLNNHIKNLADTLGVTFVFAGVNVDGTGLFDEGLTTTDTVFSQIGGRMARYELRGYPYESDEWTKLVEAFEKELILDRHEPGTLVRLSNYLHRRTRGSIGSLTNLLRKATYLTITAKKEYLDHALLQQVKVDRNAEVNYARHAETET